VGGYARRSTPGFLFLVTRCSKLEARKAKGRNIDLLEAELEGKIAPGFKVCTYKP